MTRKEGPAARPPTSCFSMSLSHLSQHLEILNKCASRAAGSGAAGAGAAGAGAAGAGAAGARAAGAGAAPAASSAAVPAKPSASHDPSAPSLSSTAKSASQASSAPLPSTDAASKDVVVVEGDQKKFPGRRWVARYVYGDGGYSVHGVLTVEVHGVLQ